MKATINGVVLEGTPEEILKYQELTTAKVNANKYKWEVNDKNTSKIEVVVTEAWDKAKSDLIKWSEQISTGKDTPLYIDNAWYTLSLIKN